ncbi:hypothetical protein ERO13_D08G177150v2 [Gossypium hirsutum]|nr:hypothetical protein ERO13_D08G177150v2 [Gossypium hirsutum]
MKAHIHDHINPSKTKKKNLLSLYIFSLFGISKGSSKRRNCLIQLKISKFRLGNFQNLKVVIQSKLPLLSSLVPLKLRMSFELDEGECIGFELSI